MFAISHIYFIYSFGSIIEIQYQYFLSSNGWFCLFLNVCLRHVPHKGHSSNIFYTYIYIFLHVIIWLWNHLSCFWLCSLPNLIVLLYNIPWSLWPGKISLAIYYAPSLFPIGFSDWSIIFFNFCIFYGIVTDANNNVLVLILSY